MRDYNIDINVTIRTVNEILDLKQDNIICTSKNIFYLTYKLTHRKKIIYSTVEVQTQYSLFLMAQ